MKKYTVTASIYQDTRYIKQNNTYPIKLRITYKRKQVYYRLINDKKEIYSFSIEEFNEIIHKKTGKFNTIRLEFAAIEKRAIDIIQTIEDFSFETFEKLFFTEKEENKNNVLSDFETYIAELTKDSKIETASLYKVCKHQITNFLTDNSKENAKIPVLSWQNITVKFLKDFEKYLLDKEKSYNTISIYIRCLNRLFNEAIRKDKIKSELYPFGNSNDKYQIPKEKPKTKKALTKEEVKSLISFPTKEKSSEDFAKDIWLFSFLCNGMNLVDIANLRYKDYSNNEIKFYRIKTKNRNQYKTEITIMVLPEIQTIIEKWCNADKRNDNYIFPIISSEMNEIQKRARVKQTTKNINKYIKRIAIQCGINKNVTTYFARHSFATISKKLGFSYEFIQECLGHTDLATTKNYLGSFDSDTKKDFVQTLWNSINKD